MPEIAIVTDSNSGITQEAGRKLGIHVLPMPFMINEETFYEDIDLTQEEFYDKLASGANIGTSQPSPESVMKLWDTLLKECDEIVHIPMSSGLSGSCQSAMILAEEYEGKVQVVNNQRISVTQRQSCLDAKLLAGKGMNARQIREFLEADKFNSSIYIMLDTLYYLKKGGRITPAAAAIGTMLRLKPVLQIQGDKLDAFAKARTTNQGKSIMMNAIKSDIENRFGGMTEDKHIWLQIAHTANLEAAQEYRREIEEVFPGYDIHIDALSLSVACHIGPGALAFACCRKIEV
ncbi:DegV family protein [Acetatifactor muris]|uniref:DegV domain-containing protein n=1 Tax=Acetatifactor muris TaxID=879566 RepID=A0A2K4ZM11_9FIRM|nr:DegV family protein [Acetatifactor muris]MCI8800234.1 DegV family protein [Lachnospiraceae bacterium]MCR2049798.1 DegV family protein [Acetatifactor muris]SOY31527.1 DegV domain-containing protein [Acetatifactor muris]